MNDSDCVDKPGKPPLRRLASSSTPARTEHHRRLTVSVFLDSDRRQRATQGEPLLLPMAFFPLFLPWNVAVISEPTRASAMAEFRARAWPLQATLANARGTHTFLDPARSRSFAQHHQIVVTGE